MQNWKKEEDKDEEEGGAGEEEEKEQIETTKTFKTPSYVRKWMRALYLQANS